MVPQGELAVETGDSLSVDTMSVQPAPVYGLLLTPPEPIPPAPQRSGSEGVSFILCGLFLIFFIISLRFRNNYKYVLTMMRSLVETKTRHNVFDDTVSEASMIFLLNLLWCACAGIVGFCVYLAFNPSSELWSHRAIGMLVGMGIAGVYALFMWAAYGTVGWIFSDRVHALLWVKGYSSSQALMAPALFVTSLISICRPEISLEIGIVSAVVFILVKIIFIWKGFRIFFSQFSSWVLFLCYLCSLEIVPLILCYRCTVLLSEML